MRIEKSRARAQREGRPENWFLRMATYLHDGILFERARLRWHYFARDQKQGWWDRQKKRGRVSFVYTVQPGVRMRLFFRDEFARGIFIKDFEFKERRFLDAFLKPGDVYIDIGANIGLFTLIAARCVGPQGHVHAIEPVAGTFRQLGENIALNHVSNVSLHQIAFSDNPGQAEIFVSLDGHAGLNSLARPSGEEFVTETVVLSRLDDFLAVKELTGHVAMIKLDVEGWEAHVLAGGRRTFSSPTAPVLQIEFTSEASQSAGISSVQLYQLLVEMGYRLFDYDERLRRLLPVGTEAVNRPHINLFAIKNSDEVARRLRKQ